MAATATDLRYFPFICSVVFVFLLVLFILLKKEYLCWQLHFSAFYRLAILFL